MGTGRTPWLARCIGTLALASALVLSGLPTAGPALAQLQDGTASAKVDPQVLAELAAGRESTVWVLLKDQADLAPAKGKPDWAEQGRNVIDKLQTTAGKGQGRVKQLLNQRGKAHKSFWLVNTISVKADMTTVDQLARLPEVAAILPDTSYEIPEPIPAAEQATAAAAQWNLALIGADRVWSELGVSGEGIVVANIDTGVLLDHPALSAQYRGRQADGTVDHNYNWFDPAGVCPGGTPCDNNGHGTHTMGTMVGDDGATRIGVAPGARWIAAKGCEEKSCSRASLLESGQWLLAPTDLNGNNPRPDLRPHIINNSWGNPNSGDPYYHGIVQAWTAAGIFPVFSNGNNGPGCATASSPGSYPESYAVGAFDKDGNIAAFSSRGPGAFGGKPNIAAPGVSIRSAYHTGGYVSMSGTSMAAPHVAGTIALMWSAAPGLVGDIEATRTLLDQTALPVSDLSCGGTDENNNVWGRGKLRAFDAVAQSPRGDTGVLAGTVLADPSGTPIPGVKLRVTGVSERLVFSGADGSYQLTLPVGEYAITAWAFGFETATGTVTIMMDQTLRADWHLPRVPSHPVSGYVRDEQGKPIANARVTIKETPIPTVTAGPDGLYQFDLVPAGSYQVKAEAGGCNEPITEMLAVAGPSTHDFALPGKRDAYGYTCEVVGFAQIQAQSLTDLTGDDTSARIDLPFPFTLYGRSYQSVHISTNGFINFLGPTEAYLNDPIPSSGPPNAAVYVFWDDLMIDDRSGIRTQLLGQAPDRRFVIAWENATFFFTRERRLDFQVILHENGQITAQYDRLEGEMEQGSSATVGLESHDGTIALQNSHRLPSLQSGLAVRYNPPVGGTISGRVTDSLTGAPVSDATVLIKSTGGAEAGRAELGADGTYQITLPLGDYRVQAVARNYASDIATVALSQAGQRESRDFALQTTRANITPGALRFVMRPGQTTASARVAISNTGSGSVTWKVMGETGGGLIIPAPPDDDDKEPEDPTLPGTTITDAGRVVASWKAVGPRSIWGLGFTGEKLWLSELNPRQNHEFTLDGTPTGRIVNPGWPKEWPADMAYDADRNLMCQVKVGGDNGIYCWDPETGEVKDAIAGNFPWADNAQRGLAYRAEDDTFYLGGSAQGIIYQIKGLSYPDKGAIVNQCVPPDSNIAGLAYNPAFGILWQATNSPTDTIYQLNPDTCEILGTMAHPNPNGRRGGGLEMDANGNLWMVDIRDRMVYQVETDVPAFVDVPWLSSAPAAGEVSEGQTGLLEVTVDASGLAPGAYLATLFIQTNSGQTPVVKLPVTLVIPAYYQAVNAGGDEYVDQSGEAWAADAAYVDGGFGYVDAKPKISTTPREIQGTSDDALYQDGRRGEFEYRFDGLANGYYQVDLYFAEILNQPVGKRHFSVAIEGEAVLADFDIAAEAGNLAPVVKTFLVRVEDGQLNVSLTPFERSDGEALLNAIRVIHRPDR